MKPMIFISPGEMNSAHMTELRKNGICVVVTKNPASIRFVDPLPAAHDRGKIELAAIAFSRKVLKQGFWRDPDYRKTITEIFVDCMIGGTPLDSEETQQEVEKKVYSQERMEEVSANRP